MTEFKVGDKATRHGREVEITYGPFTSTLGFSWCVVRNADGKEDTARREDLTPIPVAPTFDVGDIVTLTTRNARATVEYGPFDNPGRVLPDVYVVKLVDPPADDNPRTFTALASVMEKVAEPTPVKVGDRVRVLVADSTLPDLSEQFTGRVGVVNRIDNGRSTTPFRIKFGPGHHGNFNGSWWCESVEKVADEPADGFRYKGVTYEYGVTYTDGDGDSWKFDAPADEGDEPESARGSFNVGSMLSDVVDSYGPLTK